MNILLMKMRSCLKQKTLDIALCSCLVRNKW